MGYRFIGALAAHTQVFVYRFLVGGLALALWFEAVFPPLYGMLLVAVAWVTEALFRGAVGDIAMDSRYDLLHFLVYKFTDFTDGVFFVYASLAAALHRP